ncbi:hypothetical protein GIS00_13315 [Nakamurella sp. YIM 132087]|uniref:Uncharacterized protein n=1 Tax=Nakamurella alba TaxID=2665158 RepID=A0A7K1FNN0_9ACTN|nr:hypothetical protein [Nakamurella alba]MTD14919.1 hypothetical protein [Nakamurella alba]
MLRLPGRLLDTAGQVIDVVPRVVAVVGEVEQLMARVSGVVDSVEVVQKRALAQVDRVAEVVSRAQHTARTADDLLDGFAPALRTLQPIVDRLAKTTDPDEVEAVVRLVDLLPELVGKLRTDILPILDTLGTVAPDLRDLLDVSRELNEIIGSVPGLGHLKRKAEERRDTIDAESYRADEIPPASPDRGGPLR